MLEAAKSPWFEAVFAVYNRNLLKRRFKSFHISGLENLAAKDPRIPLIIYANHSGWWDGLAAFEIWQRAGLDAFIMMEEKQLAKLKLFRRLGAFSVVREHPRQAARSLNYARGLLSSDPRRTLWIFPQGEIRPNDMRPLHFYQGLARLVQKLGACAIAGIALRYEFLGDFKPEIFARIGAVETISHGSRIDRRIFTRNLSLSSAAQLDELKSDIISNNLTGYHNLI